MKRRIKALYWLTIAAIVAFGWMEGQWLKQRYAAAMEAAQQDVFGRVTGIFHEDSKRREAWLDGCGKMIQWTEQRSGGDSVEYVCRILLVERDDDRNFGEEEFLAAKEGRLPGVLDFQEQRVKGGYELSQSRVLDATKAAIAVRRFPLRTDSLRAVVDSVSGGRPEVRVERRDSAVWEPGLVPADALCRPRMQVVYPLNPFDGVVVVADIAVPFDATVREMAMTLLLSLVVAVLLVFCLVYQMATIRRQQKVAELQKNFTLTMLHELKRPLGALKLFISFMRNERLDAADREAALANGAREIDNLSSYFNKLRAITYNEASEVPLSLGSFNLKEAVEESAAMVAGAQVSLQGDGDVEIVAERQGIVNVLCNLIENAVKYSESSIEISWKADAGNVVLSVADRGRGIPDADKPFIFDQFYRAAAPADISGMGLGLAYVRQVVEAHGGTVSVKDRDGGGTVFTIQLPQ